MLKSDQDKLKADRAANKTPYRIPAKSKKRLEAEVNGSYKPKQRKPIAKESHKRKAQNRLYSKQAKRHKEENPICQRCKVKPATETHHPEGRNGYRLNDYDSFVSLCNDCHTWATINSNEAISEGISKSRTGNAIKK